MWYNEDDEADDEETFFNLASSPEEAHSCCSTAMSESSDGYSASSSPSSSATTSPFSSVGPTVYEMAQKSIAALGDCDDEMAAGGVPTRRTLDLPRNLYLAAPGLIGMGAPTCADHIRNLHALFNVRLVISLRESPNCDDWFEGLPVRSVHLPIPSYCAPSLDAMLLLLDLFRAVASSSSSPSSSSNDSSEHSELLPSQGVVAVHCLEGKGRTGTICAAYLLHQHPDLAAAQAIALIRSRSPLSIESKEQEQFLHRFAHACRDSERCGERQERLSLASSSSSSSFSSRRTPAASTVSLPSLTAMRSTLKVGGSTCSAALQRATRRDALAAGDEEEDSPGWYYY